MVTAFAILAMFFYIFQILETGEDEQLVGGVRSLPPPQSGWSPSSFPAFLISLLGFPSVRSVSFLVSCFPSLCPRFLVSFLGFPSVRLVSFLVSCFLPHVLVSVCPWWVSLSARSVYFLVQLSLLSCWRLLKISSPCFSVHQLKNTLTVFFANQVAYSFSACNDIDDSSIKEVKNWRRRQNWYFVAGMLWGATGLVEWEGNN